MRKKKLEKGTDKEEDSIETSNTNINRALSRLASINKKKPMKSSTKDTEKLSKLNDSSLAEDTIS
jgi:hypothetical protein